MRTHRTVSYLHVNERVLIAQDAVVEHSRPARCEFWHACVVLRLDGTPAQGLNADVRLRLCASKVEAGFSICQEMPRNRLRPVQSFLRELVLARKRTCFETDITKIVTDFSQL